MSDNPNDTNGATEERAPSPVKSGSTSPRKSKSRSPKRSRSPRKQSPGRTSRSRSPAARRRSRSRSYSRSPPNRRHRTPPPTEPSRVLGVFGLAPTTREEDLREEFSRYGELERAELILDKRTGNSRCFGFIYFANVEDAVKAKEAMNGIKLHGRSIRTDFSTTHKPHSPTPGRYMGRVTDTRRAPPPRDRDRRDRDRDRDRGGYYDRDRERGYSPHRRSPRRDRYDPYYDRDRYYRDKERYYEDRDRYRDRDYY